MPKKEEEESKKGVWSVQLAIVNENEPPKKVLINKETEETIDEWGYKAKVLNNMEELKKLL